MDCPTDRRTNREFLEQWGRRAEEERVPLSGMIELTRRCNLRCAHCYLGKQEAQHRLRDAELSTWEMVSVVDQVAEAGCLYLLITGGEPLLRPDFPEIYRRAKSNGLVVTVFTNGTLVTDEVVRLFEELPPHEVEITLYGASPEVYERITRVPGSFARCLEGIERLRRADIPLGLKTILMTWNREELLAMQETAGRLGLGFRFDAAISPCLDGTAEPLALRIDAAEAVAAEFADEKRRRAWLDFYRRSRKAQATGDLYECGAGLTGFHVDPFGNLQMCLMAPEPGYSLKGGTFAEGWHEAVPGARSRRASPDNPCLACDKRELCGYCPGLFKIETGNPERPSQFVCDMGTHRLEQILRSR